MDNGEGDNALGESGIEAAQDESDDCLGDQAEDRGPFWSNSFDNTASMINETMMTPGKLDVLFWNTVSKRVYNR